MKAFWKKGIIASSSTSCPHPGRVSIDHSVPSVACCTAWYGITSLQLIFELKQGNPSEGVKEKNREDQMNNGDWRAFMSIFNMQISPWLPFWICKLADFQTQAG